MAISPDICRLAVTMSERYITDRYLPDKAIDLIDEASSDVNLQIRNWPAWRRLTRSWLTTPGDGAGSGLYRGQE